ncbi:MAG: hypothetical protein IPL39_17935 [Opitutaceae bacterium]|nr:hypothetical protein [Opitutaceae bacterium]
MGEAAADDDGDGASNRTEALAGTDALDGSSRPEATLRPGLNGLRLHWQGAVHRRYRIETSADLATWDPANDLIFTGGEEEINHLVHVTGDRTDPRRYWRVAYWASDLDGDGILDSEERALGTDPTVAAVAPALPATPLLPAWFQTRLEALAAPQLAGIQSTPVKIPGLREQVLDAQVNDRNRVWANVAPGFANVVYDAQVSGEKITAILDLGGLVQSVDGGATWRQLTYDRTGNGTHRFFFSFDISPASPQVLVVGSQYLSRSEDGGRTWSEVRDPALPPVALAAKPGTDGAVERTVFGKVRFNADGSRVFAALGAFGHDRKERYGWETQMAARFDSKRLYLGDGTGRNFREIRLGTTFAGVRCLAPDPRNPQVVYVSFGDGTLYVTRNAKAVVPTFTELAVEAGYQVIDIAPSPHVAGGLLLTLMSDAEVAVGKLLRATDPGDGTLVCTQIVFHDGLGGIVPSHSLLMARWDPRDAKRVFVGRGGVDFVVVSDDDLKTFRRAYLPAALLHGEPGHYAQPHWFALDRDSGRAIAWSTIGAWRSEDRFATWEDLWMEWADGVFANRGVGFAECAGSFGVGAEAIYMSTTDHGVFRSAGAGHDRWRRVSPDNGTVLDPESGFIGKLYLPVGVSPDEGWLYTVARDGEGRALYTKPDCKLLRSRDRGVTWTDATSAVSATGLLPAGHEWRRIGVSPDGRSHWLLAKESIYVSTDSGATFARAVHSLPANSTGVAYIDYAYDAPRRLLYVATNGGLLRSRDGGATWERLGELYLPGIGVTGAGDLVLGIGNELVVISPAAVEALAAANRFQPYFIRAAGCVRATVGDTVEEASSSQSIFERIACRGDTVVAAVGAGARAGNRICGAGVLLSRDGGRTFSWATYNLPSAQVFCSAVTADDILLGCAGGAYRWDLKAIPLNPAPAR